MLLARLLSTFTTNPPKVECVNPITIYASSNGVHMDLILFKEHFPKIEHHIIDGYNVKYSKGTR